MQPRDSLGFPRRPPYTPGNVTSRINYFLSPYRSLEKLSPLHGLRFHDLRHHSITELAESQTSDQTIMAIAGHVSLRMLSHYSRVRLDAKRRAVDGLAKEAANSKKGIRAGVTSHRTSQIRILALGHSLNSLKRVAGTTGLGTSCPSRSSQLTRSSFR